MVSLAFLANAVAEGALIPFYILQQGWAKWLDSYVANSAFTATIAIHFATLPIAAVGAFLLVKPRASKRPGPPGTTWVLCLCAFGLFAAGMFDVTRAVGWSELPAVFMLGLVRTLIPVMAGYAIMRQRLQRFDVFALDVQFKWAIKGGTLGAMFFSLFFVISEGAAETFKYLAKVEHSNPLWANVFGIAGAGLLVFMLHPVQRLADRISGSAAPHSKPIQDMTDRERADLYREQAALAWMDGLLSVKERILLDSLRKRLQVSVDVASRIEREAAQGGRK